MNLVPVDPYSDAHLSVLYWLLATRDKAACISHKKMPSFQEHTEFVQSRPYDAWYMLLEEAKIVGAIYLTNHSEVGIALEVSSRGKGIGPEAIQELMIRHPRERYAANVAIANEGSQRFFEGKLGWKKVSMTYEFVRP